MNIRNSQQGIAHPGLIIVLVLVVAVIGFAGFRVIKSTSDTDKQPSTASQNKSEANLELQNVGLTTIDNVLVTNDALREYDSLGLKGFYPFGDKLGGKTDTRLNPNFEFSSLKEGTQVIAAIDGKITFIKQQTESGDSEVFLQPSDNSIWMIGYDHLTHVQVKQGDNVKAGAVIGEPARQNNGALRFEFQVNKEQNNTTTHVCPSTLLASDVKDSVLGQLSAMQESWNEVTGQNLYNVSAQNPAGCILQTMTPQQAEGR